MASNDSINDDEAFSFAMQVSTASVLPMVLKSALELDLLELIKKADPDASASELAAQLPTSNPDAASKLDRILWLLAAHSILIYCPRTLPDGGVERRYSLAPISKFLTKNEDGVSVAPVCHMVQDKVFTDLWYHLKDAVLKGGIPFDRAHGSSIFDYLSTDPRASNVFNQNMSNMSTIYMKKILEIYKGFEGIKTLVDVGGGTGATISMIVSKHPSIKGINFDLPYVITEAPSYPGVEHVGGDMFVSVPKADAILLKWICHDWNDAHCEKLLKRCYEALSINGKVIISEQIITQDSTSERSFPAAAIADMIMLGYNPGGKERTENEFRALAKKAGFKKFRKVCSAYGIWIMELYD